MKKEEIQQKIKIFFEDKTNLLFLAIFIFGVILRLKYLTINQAVWYDEAEYLSAAKGWAFGVPFQLHFVRPPLMPFIWVVFYKLGAGELVFRIILLLFSLAGIWLTYSIGKMLFNKYVGIIASALTSFHYLNLFYTSRLMTDVPSMTLLLFTIYFFWKGYVEEKGFYLYLMGLAFILSVLMRFPGGSLGGVLLIYLLLTEGFKFLKNKKLWASIGIFFLVFLPYGVWYYNTYNKIPILGASGFYMHQVMLKKSLSFMPTVFMSPIPYLFDILPYDMGQFFILALLIGLGMILFNISIGWDFLKKDKNLQKQLFVFLWIMVIFSYFAFYAGLVEDRYFFYIYPACFMIIGWVFVKLNDLLKNYNKFLGIIFIMMILFLVGYKQLTFADQLIKIKANSYVQFRQAGEWIKANSQEGDSIVASGEPMFAYYSERKVHYWFHVDNEEDFYEQLLEKRPKYMVLSIEGSPQWSYPWPQNNPDKAVPVQAYFFDAEKTKPVVVIYQLIYSET